jgi:hypothetical protein
MVSKRLIGRLCEVHFDDYFTQTPQFLDLRDNLNRFRVGNKMSWDRLRAYLINQVESPLENYIRPAFNHVREGITEGIISDQASSETLSLQQIEYLINKLGVEFIDSMNQLMLSECSFYAGKGERYDFGQFGQLASRGIFYNPADNPIPNKAPVALPISSIQHVVPAPVGIPGPTNHFGFGAKANLGVNIYETPHLIINTGIEAIFDKKVAISGVVSAKLNLASKGSVSAGWVGRAKRTIAGMEQPSLERGFFLEWQKKVQNQNVKPGVELTLNTQGHVRLMANLELTHFGLARQAKQGVSKLLTRVNNSNQTPAAGFVEPSCENSDQPISPTDKTLAVVSPSKPIETNATIEFESTQQNNQQVVCTVGVDPSPSDNARPVVFNLFNYSLLFLGLGFGGVWFYLKQKAKPK